MTVASRSMTIHPVKSLPATASHGKPCRPQAAASTPGPAPSPALSRSSRSPASSSPARARRIVDSDAGRRTPGLMRQQPSPTCSSRRARSRPPGGPAPRPDPASRPLHPGQHLYQPVGQPDPVRAPAQQHRPGMTDQPLPIAATTSRGPTLYAHSPERCPASAGIRSRHSHPRRSAAPFPHHPRSTNSPLNRGGQLLASTTPGSRAATALVGRWEWHTWPGPSTCTSTASWTG